MQSLDNLLITLEFKRQVLLQLPLVSTLLAGLAVSIALVLVTSAERGRLRACMLVALTLSALLFVLATVLDAAILPGVGRAIELRNPDQLRGFITLSRVVVWTVLCGIVCLLGSFCGLGFLYSRRVGVLVAIASSVVVGLFIGACVFLNDVMGR